MVKLFMQDHNYWTRDFATLLASELSQPFIQWHWANLTLYIWTISFSRVLCF